MRIDISELVGKTLISVERSEDSDELFFTCNTGEKYVLYHEQDCCETVTIDDICGDLEDLVGVPILKAEEVSNEEYENAFEEKFTKKSKYGYMVSEDGGYKPESYTWTFYKFATIKGYVDVRWFGESNGYYSEGVDFAKIDKDDKYSSYY